MRRLKTVFREKERIVFTGERLLVENLDEYAFPRYEKFDLKNTLDKFQYTRAGLCVSMHLLPNKVLGRKFRAKSVNYFVEEMEYWYRKVRQFAIDDDNFTLNKKKVYEICDEIERRGLENLFIRCSNESARIKWIALAEEDERNRCPEVGFGVDGGNNRS